MNLQDTIDEMEILLGRKLTNIESRIARFSYYNGMANGVSRVVRTEMNHFEMEGDEDGE